MNPWRAKQCLAGCRAGNLDEEDEEEEEQGFTVRGKEGAEPNKRRRVSDEGAEGGLEAGALAIGMDFDLDIDLPSTSAPATNGPSSSCNHLQRLGRISVCWSRCVMV